MLDEEFNLSGLRIVAFLINNTKNCYKDWRVVLGILGPIP